MTIAVVGVMLALALCVYHAAAILPLHRALFAVDERLQAMTARADAMEASIFIKAVDLQGGAQSDERVRSVSDGIFSYSSSDLGDNAFEYPPRWGKANAITEIADGFSGRSLRLSFSPPLGPQGLPSEATPILYAVKPGSSRLFLFRTDDVLKDQVGRASMMTTKDPYSACRSFAAISKAHGKCRIDETGAMNLDFVAQEDFPTETPVDIVGTVWFLPVSGQEGAGFNGVLIRYDVSLDTTEMSPEEGLAQFLSESKTPNLVDGVKTIVRSWRAGSITGS